MPPSLNILLLFCSVKFWWLPKKVCVCVISRFFFPPVWRKEAHRRSHHKGNRRRIGGANVFSLKILLFASTNWALEINTKVINQIHTWLRPFSLSHCCANSTREVKLGVGHMINHADDQRMNMYRLMPGSWLRWKWLQNKINASFVLPWLKWKRSPSLLFRCIFRCRI